MSKINPGLYQIPRWVMYPKEDQATNLLVVSALSASHIGLSTLRMEPQFMIIGEAAGINAALAIDALQVAVQSRALELQNTLVSRGAKV